MEPVDCIDLVNSGDDYFLRLKKNIESAKQEIHLQTYFFESDSTGLEIAESLIEAAKRKVKVYVLLDGYGSKSLSSDFINTLRNENINVRFFSPWHSTNNNYIGRRLHHKIVVCDAKNTLIGGINISNKYKGSNTEKPWLDYAVEIRDESIGKTLQQLCKNIFLKKKNIKRKPIQSQIHNNTGLSIKILRNDWLTRRNEISKAYLNAFRNSEKEMIIVASYFLPGRRLLAGFKNAAARGVKIIIVLSGVSDLPIVMRATQHLYSRLLKLNIEIVEWNESVLHGKLALADAKWATIGSFNLNHLSTYGSLEMNAEINSIEFSENLHKHLIDVIKRSEKITVDTLLIKHGIYTRIYNWFSYYIVRTGLIIATYLPYKRFK